MDSVTIRKDELSFQLPIGWGLIDLTAPIAAPRMALKKAGISCSAINEINGAAIIVMDIEESEKLRASYGALTEAAERCRIKKLFFEFEQEKQIV